MKIFSALLMASAAMALESQFLQTEHADDLPEELEEVETELPGVLGQTNCCKAFNLRVGLTADEAKAFFNKGYNTVIANAYNDASVNSNVCDTLSNAWFNGIYYREIYFDPKASSEKTAATQLKEMIDHVKAYCVDDKTSTMTWWPLKLWLIIDNDGDWSSWNTDANWTWYKSLVDACKALPAIIPAAVTEPAQYAQCGVMSNEYAWRKIFGDRYKSYGADLPLWNIHGDGTPNFGDWSSVYFGGWSAANYVVKQYTPLTKVSDTNVWKDYYPGNNLSNPTPP